MKKISLDLAEKIAFNPSPSPFEAVPAEMSRSESAKMPENGYAEHSLNGSWLMSEGGDSQPDFSRAVTAQIPCTVQTALFEDGKTPDPMFGKNDKYAREAAYKIWWFKKEFDYDGGMANPCLHFDGVCHKALFYLNGVLLGEHTGMFGGPDFKVGHLLEKHNVLTVKIENSPADPKKYSEYADYDEGWKNGVVVNCVYGWHYACIPSRGIWADVFLRDVPLCDFERPFILTEDYSDGKIGLCIKAFSSGKGTVRLKVSPYNFEGADQYFEAPFECEAGQQLHFTLTVKNHKLWWPNGYGSQPLYRFTTAVIPEDSYPIVTEDITGIRQIEMRPISGEPDPESYNWRCFINGKYIFIKGTNWCTTDALLRCTEERYDRFLSLAKHQNLQLLRAWGGGMPESDYFYKKCDELGLMVQQEWPTCWDSPKTQPADALTETARIHTIRLRNHPSLVRWAGGNELSATDEPSVREMARLAFELDGTRPFHRTSPYAGSLHNYDTFWLMGEMDISLKLRAPFIGEFGMASAPNYESVARYIPTEELNLPIDRNAKTCFNYHTPRFNEFLWPESYNDMDHLLNRAKEFCEINTLHDFIFATQIAQGVAVRHTLEAQRADSPKAAGVCYYKLTDVYPACSWSTVDYYGVPKIPYYIIKDAFEPLHAMLLIESVDAAQSYPVILLDDTLSASGKDCTVMVSAYDRSLALLKKAEYSLKPDSQVNAAGSFKTDGIKEDIRFLYTELYVDGVLADDTFYIQNYRNDTGFMNKLPAASVTLTAGNDCALMENTSAFPAVGVFIENISNDTVFTAKRNFLFLPAGYKRTIKVNRTDGMSIRALNLSTHKE